MRRECFPSRIKQQLFTQARKEHLQRVAPLLLVATANRKVCNEPSHSAAVDEARIKWDVRVIFVLVLRSYYSSSTPLLNYLQTLYKKKGTCKFRTPQRRGKNTLLVEYRFVGKYHEMPLRNLYTVNPPILGSSCFWKFSNFQDLRKSNEYLLI